MAELKDGNISEYAIQPSDFGLHTASLDSIRVATKEEAKTMLLSVLDNQAGTARDIVQLNAGAAIYAAGLSTSLQDGVQRAALTIASGAAKAKLAELIQFSNIAQA